MDASQPITAADGTPLKKKLAQAMFRSKLRATGLVVPLLAFVLASFVFPILALMWQGIHNDTFERLMPNLTESFASGTGSASRPKRCTPSGRRSEAEPGRQDHRQGGLAGESGTGRHALALHLDGAQGEETRAALQGRADQDEEEVGRHQGLAGMKLTNQSLTPGSTPHRSTPTTLSTRAS